MSGLRAPGLGPIVGHTTDRTCRLWIRAGCPGDQGCTLNSNSRAIGVLTVVKKDDQTIAVEDAPAYYFRLRREYDRTGSLNLGDEVGLVRRGNLDSESVVQPHGLEPESRYTVRLATLNVDDPFRDDVLVPDEVVIERLPDPRVWIKELRNLPADASEAAFRTFPVAEKVVDRLRFLIGSCRYPGLLWKTKHADEIFGPMAREVAAPAGGLAPSFVLMVGDQIYADRLSQYIQLDLADTYEEFQERYLTTFGSPNMRRLLRSVPTYMILDDHEIEDNWTQDRIRDTAKLRLFNLAIGAYMNYQWSHGPRTFTERLHYTFECGGHPFFVLDTRTQRYVEDVADDLSDNHMLGRPSLDVDEPSQLDRLLGWLETQQRTAGNIPKFIVSSNVFVPNPIVARSGIGPGNPPTEPDPKLRRRMERTDSWPAFPTTRRRLLDWVVTKGIQNVVFLSGDIHCACVAEMSFSGAPRVEAIRVFAIKSSSFYWPFSFADGNPSDYVHDSRAPGQEDGFFVTDTIRMDYRAWSFTQTDDYCRVDVDRKEAAITVRPFDYSGNIIEKETAANGRQPLVATLRLAPW